MSMLPHVGPTCIATAGKTQTRCRAKPWWVLQQNADGRWVLGQRGGQPGDYCRTHGEREVQERNKVEAR